MSSRVLPSVASASEFIGIYRVALLYHDDLLESNQPVRRKGVDFVHDLSALSTDKTSSENMHDPVQQ